MAGRFTLEAVFKGIDRISAPVSKMRKGILRMTSRSRKGLAKLNKGFGAVTRGIKKTGLAIGAAALAAGVAIKSIVSTGADFEQAITNVGAVGLKSRDQIAVLEKQALSLGESTKFTATQVAGAMEIMAKAGFSTKEILAGIPGVLDAAAASGSEIAEVADVVSSSLKGMGLATSEAGRVSDVLALASSKTNSTIVSLGESMKNVASTARQLKVPFEEAVAGVALLQDVGLDASVAGSAMNVMLTKLAKPPKKLAREMKKMGITFKDAEGNMLPFQKVIGNISEAAKKSGGNLDQVAFLAELVGLRGQKAASNLAKLFETGKLKELTEQLKNAEGTAAKMAAIRMDTLTGDLLKLEAATDGVKIALFDMEGGPLRGVVQGMTEWIGANKELILGKVSSFIKFIVDNQDLLIIRLKQIGIGLAVFFAFSAAVKVAQGALIAIELTMKAVGAAQFLFASRTVIATTVIRAYNVALLLARGAMFLLGLSTVVTGTAIAAMSVAAAAGVAGLLIGALAVGVAFGSWLNHQFGISDMIAGWLAQITGVNDELDKAGGRRKERDPFGGPKKPKGALTPAFQAAADARDKAAANKKFLDTLPPAFRAEVEARNRGAAPPPQVVSPQERISKEISETINETNESSTLLIKDETGRAEFLKKPKGMSVEMQQSGQG